MATNGKTGTAVVEKDQDRKATILRAAIDVFATKGYHGCRIADVAREAGVAYGLVYHYFKNKDELLQSVFKSGWDYFVGHLRDAINAGQTLEEKIRGLCDVTFESYRRDPRAVRVLVTQVARSPAIGARNRQGAFEEIIRMSVGMFTEAQRTGELREDFDPTLCALLLFGALEMGLTSFVAGMSKDTPENLERAKKQVAEAFLGGVRTPEAEWKKPSSSTRSKVSKRS